MKLFLEKEDEVEISPLEDSEDITIVKTPFVVGNIDKVERADIQKELAALDALENGSRTSSLVHGIPLATTKRYANGEGLNDESKGLVLSRKHEIADKATALLMDTLGMLDPSEMDKPRDRIALMASLGNLIDKTTAKDDDKPKVMHVVMHAPNQRKIESYEVIDI